MDWEITSNTNNPLTKHIFEFSLNENKLRKNFSYLYNNEDKPIEMTINSFNTITGNQTSTFTQKYEYVKR